MAGIFDNYKIALLDSTFFISNFTDEVKNGLLGAKVYVADTINSEIEQYRIVLSADKRDIYDSNVHYLKQHLQVISLNFDSFGALSENLQNDIWGLISLLTSLKAAFVVITANQLLIQRIILKELNVDIYDLKTNGFLRYSSFSSSKKILRFSESTWEKQPVIKKVSENTTLYLNDGKKVILGKELKSGLEANLYWIKGDSNTVAKVFKKDKLSAGKYNNIIRLSGINSAIDINWAVFPKKLIYYDTDCNNVAGFIEDYVATEENLEDIPLYLGDPFNVTEDYLLRKLSYSVDLCLKVVRQVCYLNTYGFYISDYNMGNFAIRKNDASSIQMWDTDSFGYDTFFGRFFSPDYTESINHPKYDIGTKEGAIDISNDALYQFVFFIFSLGDSPISGRNGKFKYDNPKYFAKDREKFFPQNIWKHLAEVFRGAKQPSAEALMKQLVFTSNQLKENLELNKTFEELFAEVIPGFAEEREKTEETQRNNSNGKSGSNTTSTTSSNARKSTTSSTSTTSFNARKSTTSSTSTTSGTSSNVSKSRTSSKSASNPTNLGNGNNTGTVIRKKVSLGILFAILLAIFAGYYLFPEYYNDAISWIDHQFSSFIGSFGGSVVTVEEQSYFENIDYFGWLPADAVKDVENAGWTACTEEQVDANCREGYIFAHEWDNEEKKVTLFVSSGLADEQMNSKGSFLTCSNNDVALAKGENAYLTLTATGNIPDVYTFEIKPYVDVDWEWGNWIEDTVSEITITGLNICEGYIRFYFVDKTNNNYIGYTDIYITIS